MDTETRAEPPSTLLRNRLCPQMTVLVIRADPVRISVTICTDPEPTPRWLALYLHALPQIRGTWVSARQAQRHHAEISRLNA
jgi:hypothetical protein